MTTFVLSFFTMMAAALVIQYESFSYVAKGLEEFQPGFVYVKCAHGEVITESSARSFGSFTGTGSDDRIISFYATGFERPPVGENEY